MKRTKTQRQWNNKAFATPPARKAVESWWLGLDRKAFTEAQRQEEERMRTSKIGAWVWNNEVAR